MSSKTLVFFGNERLATGVQLKSTPTLQALIDADYDIKAVVSNFTPGASRSARHLEVEATAKKYGIPVLIPNKPVEIIDTLADFGAEAAVLVAYGRIVPQSIIDIFPKGIVNIHPSLLPTYRGPTPIEQAILDGTPETGVSLMQLTKQMDAGPVFEQIKMPLSGTESKQELAEKLLHAGCELLMKNLPGILDGSLIPTPQDDTKATYTQLISKADGIIDTNKTATRLEREARAFTGWPKSKAKLFNSHEVVITKARVAQNEQDGVLVIPCAEQTYLEILELIAPSGRTMSGEAFLRGYQK